MAKTYAAKKVQVVFNNQVLTGFMDGSFVEVERNSDSFTLMIGADGEGARAASADKSGTVKITLLQTSASNDVLSAVLIADELTNVAAAPLLIKDGSGRTLVSSPEAWVKKPAVVTFDKEIQGREWTIETDALAINVAGN